MAKKSQSKRTKNSEKLEKGRVESISEGRPQEQVRGQHADVGLAHMEELKEAGEEADEQEERNQEEQEEQEEDEEDEEENDIALEDAEDVDEDAIPKQKLVINNSVALDRIRDAIKLDSKLPWTETLSVTYPEKIDVDVNDDLNRELAFYKQALHGAQLARKLADQHKLPFTRPSDYFAEMVKSDAHMERIRQRLLDESAAIKKSEDKRKEREGKKYGKQVQVEKLKEREKNKKAIEERLKGLKRKRGDVLRETEDDEAFDVAVEDAISDRPATKRAKTDKGAIAHSKTKPKMSRDRRDSKFGFGGGKDRRSKQNTRQSTEQFDFGAGRKAKGAKGAKKGANFKPKRPGKSKRLASKRR